MDIKIIGSTKVNHHISKEEALEFGATLAGICYMPDSFEQLQNESEMKNKKRQKITLDNGHHSVYGHTSLNLLIEDVPKFLAMVLNNEKVYVTSEKSARYTKMDEISSLEKELYDKWMDVFEEKILEVYPRIGEKKAKKLGQENARYMTSVFTPTTLAYSTNFRQLNYIMHKFDTFLGKESNNNFERTLKPYLFDFNSKLKNVTNDYYVDELVSVNTNLSIFSERERSEFFDECYSVNYEGSFAQFAQAQRHRTLDYEMKILEEDKFFVPPILDNDKSLSEEWLKDIEKVTEKYPQGMIVGFNERGTLENFIFKGYERLCGNAQLEIAVQTKKTMDRYFAESFNPEIKNVLEDYMKGPRCTFKDYECSLPCAFGKKALERLI